MKYGGKKVDSYLGEVIIPDLPSALNRAGEKVRGQSGKRDHYKSNNAKRINSIHYLFPFSKDIEHSDKKQACDDRGKIVSILKAPFNIHFTLLRRNSDQNKENAVNASPINSVNMNIKSKRGFVKNGDMTPTVNQAAAIIFANSDKAFNCASFIALNSSIPVNIKSSLAA